MVSEVLSVLIAEQTRLENELRLLPSFRQLEAVRASIASLKLAYGASSHSEMASNSVLTSSQTNFGPVRQRRQESVTAKVIEIAEKYMCETGMRIQGKAVWELVSAAGISVSGEKPASVVSSILSHANRFDNRTDMRGTGYGLAEWSAPKENEPSSGHAVGSDAAVVGVSSTPSAPSNP